MSHVQRKSLIAPLFTCIFDGDSNMNVKTGTVWVLLFAATSTWLVHKPVGVRMRDTHITQAQTVYTGPDLPPRGRGTRLVDDNSYTHWSIYTYHNTLAPLILQCTVSFVWEFCDIYSHSEYIMPIQLLCYMWLASPIISITALITVWGFWYRVRSMRKYVWLAKLVCKVSWLHMCIWTHATNKRVAH